MSTCEMIKFTCEIMLHIKIIILHVDINKSHVNIIMLHVDIIYTYLYKKSILVYMIVSPISRDLDPICFVIF